MSEPQTTNWHCVHCGQPRSGREHVCTTEPAILPPTSWQQAVEGVPTQAVERNPDIPSRDEMYRILKARSLELQQLNADFDHQCEVYGLPVDEKSQAFPAPTT